LECHLGTKKIFLRKIPISIFLFCCVWWCIKWIRKRFGITSALITCSYFPTDDANCIGQGHHDVMAWKRTHMGRRNTHHLSVPGFFLRRSTSIWGMANVLGLLVSSHYS
jgi:hypothetical protein